jgi:hypothetical protein
MEDGISLRKPKSNELSDMPSHSNQPGGVGAAPSTAGTASTNLTKAANKTQKGTELIKADSKQLDNSTSNN